MTIIERIQSETDLVKLKQELERLIDAGVAELADAHV